jgi:hypothetical protein
MYIYIESRVYCRLPGSWERLDEKDLDRLRALGYVN